MHPIENTAKYNKTKPDYLEGGKEGRTFSLRPERKTNGVISSLAPPLQSTVAAPAGEGYFAAFVGKN